jgi:hypothetical protein
MKKWTFSYLLEVLRGVELDVVVAAPFLFLELELDDFPLEATFFFFLCVALATASL